MAWSDKALMKQNPGMDRNGLGTQSLRRSQVRDRSTSQRVQLNFPYAVRAGKNGVAYVTDSSNDPVRKFQFANASVPAMSERGLLLMELLVLVVASIPAATVHPREGGIGSCGRSLSARLRISSERLLGNVRTPLRYYRYALRNTAMGCEETRRNTKDCESSGFR